MIKILKTFFVLTVSSMIGMSSRLQAGTVTFGSGINSFNMEFVTIGNSGNAADTTGYPSPAGSVGYTYGIGKFEVSEDMIEKYNALNQGLQISKDSRGATKPATSVSWNEAARFVNWLNTSTGGFAAYKFLTPGVNDNIALWEVSETLDYDPLNPYRSKRTTYVLPSYNEWYKAAFYNPGTDTYFDFPNESDVAPSVTASGTLANTAVYNVQTGPADVNQAGGLSPFGVMALGGNVTEWEESSLDLTNNTSSSARGIRGGGWRAEYSYVLSSSIRDTDGFGVPSVSHYDIGFRVATLSPSSPPAVPEPNMMVIGALFGFGGYLAKRRIKK